jgi:glucan-binding YG repeat protein
MREKSMQKKNITCFFFIFILNKIEPIGNKDNKKNPFSLFERKIKEQKNNAAEKEKEFKSQIDEYLTEEEKNILKKIKKRQKVHSLDDINSRNIHHYAFLLQKRLERGWTERWLDKLPLIEKITNGRSFYMNHETMDRHTEMIYILNSIKSGVPPLEATKAATAELIRSSDSKISQNITNKNLLSSEGYIELLSKENPSELFDFIKNSEAIQLNKEERLEYITLVKLYLFCKEK